MRVLVLDLDGTLIDPTQASLSQRDYLISIAKPGTDAEALMTEAEAHTLADPFGYPFLVGGTASVFAEDPYFWRYAQMRRIWSSLSTDKAPEDLCGWMFYEFEPEKPAIMEGARDFIDFALSEGFEPIIVTNSTTEKADLVCDLMGIRIQIRGNASKYEVRSGHSFKIGGRDVFTDRPSYEVVLSDIMKKHKALPKDVTVVGDVFSLDLALPLRLGMRCVMRRNSFGDGFRTPNVFVEGARKLGVPVVKDFKDVEKILE